MFGPKWICTWVRLRDRQSGRFLRVYNTHQYLTERARLRAGELTAARIALGNPADAVLVTGDFNAPPKTADRLLFDDVVAHGPSCWVRHPFYDLVFLWMISLSLLTANWLMARLGFSAVARLIVRTRIEEEKLIERFGEEYRAYTGRTGKFPPHLR